MKNLKKEITTNVCIVIFTIVFLVLPLVFLEQTAKNGTYMGNAGLKTALNTLLTGITNKIVLGAMLGFSSWLCFYNIKTYTSLGKNKLTDKYDGVKRYSFLTNVMIILVVMIIYIIFVPGKSFLYNDNTGKYKIGNEFTNLYNIIKDINSLQTEEIEVEDYEFLNLNYIERGTKSSSKYTRKELYIKFDDNNYIAITQRDKNTIEYYMKDKNNKNVITVFKNSGLLCYINGENENISDEMLKEKKIADMKKIIKLAKDKNGIIKKISKNTDINEDILGMWWEISCNGELVNKINCWEISCNGELVNKINGDEQFTQINMMTPAYKPGKYNIKIIAICKDRKKYQVSNEIVYEKLQ